MPFAYVTLFPGRSEVNARHVAGLDALRFVAAAWVVMGHLGVPNLFAGVDRSGPIAWALTSAYNNLICGPAAVIVFFVISGFCIHHPYSAGRPFHPLPFYVRRYVRIGVPLAAALAICVPLDVKFTSFEHVVLWSVVAELIYYTLYPVFRRIAKRFSWRSFLGASFVGAYAVVLLNPGARDYPSYGWYLNWVVGLPCWLLGVVLAERWASRRHFTPISSANIWMLRLGVLALSMCCSVLRFHSPLGYPWTFDIFAIAVYFWLDREIARGALREPWRWLEAGGAFSYSIYLFHVPAIGAALALLPALHEGILGWLPLLLWAVMVSYAMFRIFEQPAHRLARTLSARLGRSAAAGIVGVAEDIEAGA